MLTFMGYYQDCNSLNFDSVFDVLNGGLLVGSNVDREDNKCLYDFYVELLPLGSIELYSLVLDIDLSCVIAALKTKYLFLPCDRSLVNDLLNDMDSYFRTVLVNYSVLFGYAMKVSVGNCDSIKLVFVIDGVKSDDLLH